MARPSSVRPWLSPLARLCGWFTAPPRPRRARQLRPSFEQLEERLVPATYHSTTLADSGVGSLRDAIFRANTDTAGSTIVFDSSASGGTIDLQSMLPTLTQNLTIQGP